jgi:competence ComEA-like helix-hairpin-helix protein
LTNLLLSPPAGPIVVIGIDPGFRTGCKLAVVDETGKFLEHATIYPTEPKKNIAAAERTLLNLVQKYRVKAIDIGNGTASRETDSFVRDFLRKYQAGESFESEAPVGEVLQAGPASLGLEAKLASEVALPEAFDAEGGKEEAMIAAPRESSAPLAVEESHETLTVMDTPENQQSAAETVLPGIPATDAVAQEPEESPRALEKTEDSPLVQKDSHSIFAVIVNESGASVYSASDLARKEFPDLDVTVRGAISIARRLQDPLAEFVKIHPKSIGVGQYQHDVDQNRLREGLESSVESCVNRVGVDINTASLELLKYVSGLNQRAAKRIIEFRNQNGRFSSRRQLLEVSGFGEKTFEQAAGFLRIKGGDNPLDDTAVHPESYLVVERMATTLNVAITELVGNAPLLEKLDIRQFLDEKTGEYTLKDIKEELLKPGRDPRSQFVVPTFREDVKEVSDLKEGMELEGTVTNVTNFGAFVDIGVHQDGLVHVSEISNRFVQDPRAAVQVGQIVKVKVIGVDHVMKRISLSIKALMPKIKKTKIRKIKKLPSRPKVEAPAGNYQSAVAPKTGEARKNREPQAGGMPPRQSHERNRPERPIRQEASPMAAKGSKPATLRKESPPVSSVLTFEDKIRLLQEKFGGIR